MSLHSLRRRRLRPLSLDGRTAEALHARRRKEEEEEAGRRKARGGAPEGGRGGAAAEGGGGGGAGGLATFFFDFFFPGDGFFWEALIATAVSIALSNSYFLYYISID